MWLLLYMCIIGTGDIIGIRIIEGAAGIMEGAVGTIEGMKWRGRIE